MSFTIDQMLEEIKQSSSVKVAEEKKEEKKEDKKEESKAVMEKKIGDMVEKKDEKKEEKKAEVATDPMQKVAETIEKLAALEQENLKKEAEVIGVALADAIVSRLRTYEKTAEQEMSMEKVAEKIQTDPEFAESFYAGYMDKVAEEIEKDPEAKKAFVESYEKTAAEIVKVGTYMQDKGYIESARALKNFKEAK